jgi:hypothetical protein
MSCISCPPGVTTSLDPTQTNRVINQEVRISSSLYTANLAANSYVSPTSSSKDFVAKHGSYARVIAKRKGVNCAC